MRLATATYPATTVARDVRGAVYVEFLLVFLPVFLLFLCILELGFLYVRIENNTLTAEFINAAGQVVFTRTLTK